MSNNQHEKWDLVIQPKESLLKLNYKEVWRYRDLLWMLVKRDFVTYYKQTILGPLWFLIQPILTTLIITIIFGKMAKLDTNGQPKYLFYLAGVTLWNYFADCLNKTSNTFKDNQNIFGKVYFPRIVVPFSLIISNLVKFSIQFGIFICFLLYYIIFIGDLSISLNYIFITPLLIVIMAGLSLGLGMIITSLTTKYRDLHFLIQFSVQLLMYGSSVIFPVASVDAKYQLFLRLNPIVPIIESFKAVYLGGVIDWSGLLYSSIITIMLFITGTIIFNKTEKSFMDTI